MHVRGHNLFWAVDGGYQIPDWIKSLQGEDMKEAIDHRISTAVTHYKVIFFLLNNAYLLIYLCVDMEIWPPETPETPCHVHMVYEYPLM